MHRSAEGLPEFIWQVLEAYDLAGTSDVEWYQPIDKHRSSWTLRNFRTTGLGRLITHIAVRRTLPSLPARPSSAWASLWEAFWAPGLSRAFRRRCHCRHASRKLGKGKVKICVLRTAPGAAAGGAAGAGAHCARRQRQGEPVPSGRSRRASGGRPARHLHSHVLHARAQAAALISGGGAALP